QRAGCTTSRRFQYADGSGGDAGGIDGGMARAPLAVPHPSSSPVAGGCSGLRRPGTRPGGESTCSRVSNTQKEGIDSGRRRGLTDNLSGGCRMLVLSRKLGEKIVIPGLDVEIAVVAIKGKAVRLGIAAPAEIAVRRQEVAEQRQVVAAGAVPEDSHG